MSPVVRQFVTHKPAENPEDCQDSLIADESRGVFAVADGAGGSFFPGEWAKCLTRHFGRDPEAALKRETFAGWLRQVHADWLTQIEHIAKAPEPSFLVVNGYRGRKPAVAAFVGLQVGLSTEGRSHWQVVALGDSCLFHAGAEGRVRAYPLTKSEDFSYEVSGIASYPDKNIAEPFFLSDDEAKDRMPFVKGDFLILATDALARWLLRREECGRPVWGHLRFLKVGSKDDFERFVADARTEQDEPMQNDDVALIVVPYGPAHDVYTEQLFRPLPAVSIENPRSATVAPAAPAASSPPPTTAPAQTSPPDLVVPSEPLPPKPYRKRVGTRFNELAIFFFVAITSFALGLAINRAEVANLKKKARKMSNGLAEAAKLLRAEEAAKISQIQAMETRLQQVKEEHDTLSKQLAASQDQWIQVQRILASNPEPKILVKKMESLLKGAMPTLEPTPTNRLWIGNPEPSRLFPTLQLSVCSDLPEILHLTDRMAAPLGGYFGKLGLENTFSPIPRLRASSAPPEPTPITSAVAAPPSPTPVLAPSSTAAPTATGGEAPSEVPPKHEPPPAQPESE